MSDLDFGDDEFLSYPGKSGGNTLCVSEHFNADRAKRRLSETRRGHRDLSQYGGVKVSTGIVRYGKRVAVWARYKTYNFLKLNDNNNVALAA